MQLKPKKVENACVEILTIGREILDGRTINTNASFLGTELKALGLSPKFSQSVDDDIEAVIQAFSVAAARARIVICTGGLGPTRDDLTASTFAKFSGLKFVESTEARAHVEEFFAKRAKSPSPAQMKQAFLPESATLLDNPIGSAPGFSVRSPGSDRSSTEVLWFFLPGVPREMKKMFLEKVIPALPVRKNYRYHQWATHFTSEGDLQEEITPFENSLPEGFEVGFQTRRPENHITLYGECPDVASRKLFDEKKSELTKILGDRFFSDGQQLELLERIVIQNAARKNFAMSCVESCTGGLIAHRLTSIAGASNNFWASWTTYDNAAKVALGVDPALIENHGAVSAEVALAMSEAGLEALKRIRSLRGSSEKLICVATTGIAGPSGGSAEKPVGLCYIALSIENEETQITRYEAWKLLDRSALQACFAQKALDLIRKHLQNTN